MRAVLLDEAACVRSAFVDAGYRVVVTTPEDRRAYGTRWLDAVTDAVGPEPHDFLMVVITATDTAAFDAAQTLLAARRGSRTVLVELSTTADAERALDASQRLHRMLLEQHVALVVHCCRVAAESYADACAVALAFNRPKRFGRTLWKAHRVAEQRPCHAVAFVGGMLPKGLCEQRFNAKRMCTETWILSTGDDEHSAPVLILGLNPAKAPEQAADGVNTLDAGQLFRAFGVRAAPLFPDAPYEAQRSKPQLHVTAGHRWRIPKDVDGDADDRDFFEPDEEPEPATRTLCDAVVATFEQVTETARLRRPNNKPTTCSAPTALDLSHDVTALLRALTDGSVHMLPIPGDLLASEHAEELALCIGKALAGTSSRCGFVRPGDDATYFTLGLCARSSGVSRPRLESGAVLRDEWPALTIAVAELSDIPVTLLPRRHLDCEVGEVTASMFRDGSATVVVVDATDVPLPVARAIHADLLDAVRTGGRVVMAVSEAIATALNETWDDEGAVNET